MRSGRPRIAIIANSFDPVFGERAGGHVHLVEVAKRWQDFDLVVFAPEQARAVFERDLPTAEFVPVPSCDSLTNSKAAIFLYRSVAAAGVAPKVRSCDAILCSSHFLPDVVPAVLSASARATVVLWHLVEPPWKREGSVAANYIAYAAEKLGLLLIEVFFKHVIVGSELLARQMRLAGRKSYCVTTNGIEHLAAPNSMTERAGAIYVGRLHPTKGLEDLLKAWAIAKPQASDRRLTIVGGGSEDYERKLRFQAMQLGVLDSVAFAGPVSDEEKRRLLQSSAVFLFPSKEEGWGIAIAEAMAFGLPCVTYDLEIFREIFTGGRIAVPIGDVASFARATAALLTNEELRTKYAAEARELSRSFSWSKAAEIEGRALNALRRRNGAYGRAL